MKFLGITAFFLVLIPDLAGAQNFEGYFSQPVKCAPYKECVVQQYVDLDPSSGRSDYACGKASYDGHKGTDFRLVNGRVYHQNIDVVAMADGTVLRVRDGVMDKLVHGPEDLHRLEGKDCGNGLVIDHGAGVEAQYCHLKRGSLIVRPGERVARGDKLGHVGLSGKTEMPHVHVTFRYKGKIVDPYVGLVDQSAGSCPLTRRPWWNQQVLDAFPYQSSLIIEAGFSNRTFKSGEREATVFDDGVKPDSPALVAFVRLINLKKGDQVELKLNGPEGSGLALHKRMQAEAKYQARKIYFLGKKRRNNLWPTGTYQGRALVWRDGELVHEKGFSTQVN